MPTFRLLAVTLVLFSLCDVRAEQPSGQPAPSTKAVALNPQGTVLLDHPGKKILLKTTVCLRDGLLEMLVCPRQTKEHESILSIDAAAETIHAGLLALGAKPGHPVQFQPEYRPAAGEEIEIYLNWKDDQGRQQRVPAQDWIRHSLQRYFESPLAALPPGLKLPKGRSEPVYDEANRKLIFYGPMSEEQLKTFLGYSEDKAYQQALRDLRRQGEERPLQAKFLFAGSRFVKLTNGKEAYQANSGNLICVANFSDAMIDIDVKSSASNDSGLLFETWTERIPPLQSEVVVELIPVSLKEKK